MASRPNDATGQSRAILGKLAPQPVKFDMASGRVRFFGPTTNMHILSRSTSDPSKTPESFWPISTLVRDLSPETHDYLIDLFFDCHNSALHIVHKWAFFDDLKSGGTQFYSNFLHMAMLAEGYRYADRNRVDIRKLATPSSHPDSSIFHTKAKKIAELELIKPGMCNDRMTMSKTPQLWITTNRIRAAQEASLPFRHSSYLETWKLELEGTILAGCSLGCHSDFCSMWGCMSIRANCA